jgi:hypothetical protein
VTVTGAGLQPEQLRVGYYRSSQAAPSTFESSVAGFAESVALDPVRPYAYVSLSADHLARVNLATGAVDSVMTTAGTTLRYPVVSGDGKYLYASNNQLPGGYHVFNLDTAQPVGVWARTTLCCGGQAVWVRNRGVPALLNINLESVNAETGVYSPPMVPVTDFPKLTYLAAPGNGTALYNYRSEFVSCPDVQRYTITSRPATGQVFLDNIAYVYGLSSGPGGCVHLYSMQPTYDNSVRYVVGRQDGGNQGVLREDTGPSNPGFTVAAAGEYVSRIHIADSGVKLVVFQDSSDNYLRGRILATNNSIVGSPFGHYVTINDVALTGDERFALLLNSSALALFRLP